MKVYLDNNATTMLDPEAYEAMKPFLEEMVFMVIQTLFIALELLPTKLLEKLGSAIFWYKCKR